MNMLDERYKTRVVKDVCRFVSIPSRSSAVGGEEGELQLLVAELMRQAGARVRTFEADDIPEFLSHQICHGPNRQYNGRATVIGEIGPEDAPALLVLAHSDTVQINSPDDWTFDPFCGEVRDGKILGLGSGDDKWGLAVMLVIMRALQESGRTLNKRLIFASIIDEENGVGNGTLLLGLGLGGVKVEEAMYLDGYGMKVLIGNLGGSNLYLRPKVSMDLSYHGKVLGKMCVEFGKERARLFNQPWFEDNVRKSDSIIFRQIKDDKGDFLQIAFYTLPGEDRGGFCRDLEDRVRTCLGDDFGDYELFYREPWFEPGLSSPDTAIVKCLAESVEEVTSKSAHITTITKQDRFVLTNHFGIPTVSFGPRGVYSISPDSGRGGNHQPDEYMDIEELWAGAKVAYGAVVKSLNTKYYLNTKY